MVWRQVERRPVTVYGLRSTQDGKIRYVGQTVQKLPKRLNSHLNPNVNARQRRLMHWINSVKDRGFRVEIFPICDDAVWNDTERRLIAFYRRHGARLVNSTDGGDGCLGRVWTQEQRAKQSVTLTGRKKSIEHVARMRDVRRGVALSAETRARISLALKGRKPANLEAIQAANKGIVRSPDLRERISKSLRGRQVTATEKLMKNLAKGRVRGLES